MTSLNSVLIVDDEPAVRDIMSRWVTSLGLHPKAAASADEALATLRTHDCDLAVIDIMMPGRDGIWLATEMQKQHPHTALVMATAYTELLEGEKANIAIADLLIKPFPRERFMLAVERGRQWRKEAADDLRWHAQLSLELNDRIDHVCAQIEREAARGAAEFDVIMRLAQSQIPETQAHAERVLHSAAPLIGWMGVEDTVGPDFERAALLHDIGKLVIPEPLLTKPSTLTLGEVAIMRRHVDAGAEILASTRTLHQLAPVVLASHEWFSGGGYPIKLSGSDIPLASRIIAVCDAYDVMTIGRRYRGRLDQGEAVTELLRCANTQFDPDIVSAFVAIVGRR